jgi:hypothetical protein
MVILVEKQKAVGWNVAQLSADRSEEDFGVQLSRTLGSLHLLHQ